MEVAEEFYTRSYFEDMDALGVLRPDISPRATGHIIEQIEITKEAHRKGAMPTLLTGRSISTSGSSPQYGKLSRRTLDEMLEAGTRVEVRSEKRNPQDFALWKRAEPQHISAGPVRGASGSPAGTSNAPQCP
jgi:cysteinyl-tRNA synthetase